nr:hypothetical protein [uncultured Oscillibacter sp.]
MAEPPTGGPGGAERPVAMKFANETEQEFLARFYKWKRQGMCLFRDDANREFILDLIDAYIDAKEALYDANN